MDKVSFEQMVDQLKEFPISAIGYRDGLEGVIKFAPDLGIAMFWDNNNKPHFLNAKLSVDDLLAKDWIIGIRE